MFKIVIVSITFIFALALNRLPLKMINRHSDQTLNLFGTSDSVINLTNFNNMQYYTSFAVGTPGQQLTVVLDTGSTILWVPSTNCTECHKAKQYDPTKSSTAQMSTKVDELVYGKGKCTGYYGSETVMIGSVTVSKMPMMFVYDNTDFQNFMADGLMGLSNSRINNIFDIAYSKQQLVSSMFAFELSTLGSSRPSSFYYNVTLADFPQATFVKCTRQDYWTIPITEFKVQGTSMPVSQALIDSGTSLIVFPTVTLQAIYARFFSECPFDSTKKYKICNCKANLPTLQFTTKGLKFEITPQMYLQKIFLSPNCYVLFDGIDAVPFMILGDIFMRNYITIFDKKNNAVGIQGQPIPMTQEHYPNVDLHQRQHNILPNQYHNSDHPPICLTGHLGIPDHQRQESTKAHWRQRQTHNHVRHVCILQSIVICSETHKLPQSDFIRFHLFKPFSCLNLQSINTDQIQIVIMETQYTQIPFQRNVSITDSNFEERYSWTNQPPRDYEEIEVFFGGNAPEICKQYSYASDVEKARYSDQVKIDTYLPVMSNQASISSMIEQNMEVETNETLKKLRRSSESDSEYEEELEVIKKCHNARNVIRRKKPNRDLTTIAKVIFTQIKKQLKEKCPINLKPYFDVCPYEVNHRTLMDFQVPFLYVQLLDQVRPGSLQLFKNFLKEVKPAIINNAQISYASRNKERFDTFKTYLDRIYQAYMSNKNSEGRMNILYSGVSNPKVLLRLRHLEQKLKQII